MTGISREIFLSRLNDCENVQSIIDLCKEVRPLTPKEIKFFESLMSENRQQQTGAQLELFKWECQ